MFLEVCPETPTVVKIGPKKNAWQFTCIPKDVIASDIRLLK